MDTRGDGLRAKHDMDAKMCLYKTEIYKGSELREKLISARNN